MQTQAYVSMIALVMVTLCPPLTCHAVPLGTAFTYQGQVKESGQPIDGLADFQFSLWSTSEEGSQYGDILSVTSVNVTDGLFTVHLDFGSVFFTTDSVRWLQIAVRSPAGNGAYTTLLPRQPLTPCPYSLHTRGIFVTEEGKVGIGTTNPTLDFHVSRLVGLHEERKATLGVRTARPIIGGDPYASWLYLKAGSPSSLNHDSRSNLTIGTEESIGGTFKEHMRITYDGKVGIGTDNPSNLLTIAGRVALSRGDVVDTILLDPSSSGAAVVSLRRADGTQTVKIDADDDDDAAKLTLYDGSSQRIELDARGAGRGAQMALRNNNSVNTVVIDAADGADAGYIELRPGLGSATIGLYAGSGGKGRVVTGVLEITGGSDLAEKFEVSSPDGSVQPGMVVCINSSDPGTLMVSCKAYDPRVAGILSGAGGVDPGMLMKQSGSVADGAHPVALTGRVYCLADASTGAIEAGDLLTTSNTPGHAMKAADYSRSHGAILGKAMTPLERGRGLVLVLVSLQ